MAILLIQLICRVHHAKSQAGRSTGWNLKLKRVKPFEGFPGSSAGKESTYSAGDPGLIPGSGNSPGGTRIVLVPLSYIISRVKFSVQKVYLWASLVAQW